MRCPTRGCRADLIIQEEVQRTAPVCSRFPDATASASWIVQRCSQGHVVPGTGEGAPAEIFELDLILHVDELLPTVGQPSAKVRRSWRGVESCGACGANPMSLVPDGTLSFDETVDAIGVPVRLQVSVPRIVCVGCRVMPTGGRDLHPTEDAVGELVVGILQGWELPVPVSFA